MGGNHVDAWFCELIYSGDCGCLKDSIYMSKSVQIPFHVSSSLPTYGNHDNTFYIDATVDVCITSAFVDSKDNAEESLFPGN